MKTSTYDFIPHRPVHNSLLLLLSYFLKRWNETDDFHYFAKFDRHRNATVGQKPT